MEYSFMQSEQRKCPTVKIPLCQLECLNQRTRFNQFINTWLSDKYRKEAKKRIEKNLYDITRDPWSILRYIKQQKATDPATNTINESTRKNCCLPNPPKKRRVDYCKPEDEPYIDPKQSRKQHYLTTNDYKRISPEFLQLLNKCDTSPPVPPDVQKTFTHRPKPKKIEIVCNPWENYLKYMMDQSDDHKFLYGLDFDDTIESDDKTINPFELSELLQKVNDRRKLNNDQLDRLIHLLLSAANLSREDLIMLLRALYKQGVLTPIIVDYMQKVLVQIGSKLNPKQAKTIILALSRTADYSSNQPIVKMVEESVAVEPPTPTYRCFLNDPKNRPPNSMDESCDNEDTTTAWNDIYPWINIQNYDSLKYVKYMPEVSEELFHPYD